MYPKATSWIISHSCNLKCAHCYVDSVAKETSAKRLLDSEIRQACKNISTVNPEGIIISGEEPLLCSRLFTYLKEDREVTENLWICSNGTIITKALLR